MVYIDIIASIGLFILGVFLMWKAVCQWDNTQTFKNWDAKRQNRIYLWKRRLKEMPEDFWEWLKNLSRLKKLYFLLASIVVSIFFYSFWFIFPEFIDKIDDGKTSFLQSFFGSFLPSFLVLELCLDSTPLSYAQKHKNKD